MAPRYTRLGFEPRGRPFPRRDLNRRRLSDTTSSSDARCIHNCDFCVVPAAGIEALPEAVEEVVADIRGRFARLIFIDLNLIADKATRPAVRSADSLKCGCSASPHLLGRSGVLALPRGAAARVC